MLPSANPSLTVHAVCAYWVMSSPGFNAKPQPQPATRTPSTMATRRTICSPPRVPAPSPTAARTGTARVLVGCPRRNRQPGLPPRSDPAQDHQLRTEPPGALLSFRQAVMAVTPGGSAAASDHYPVSTVLTLNI